jgi:uncharacterized protein (TIGR03437 family)
LTVRKALYTSNIHRSRVRKELMNRLLLFLIALSTIQSQIVVDTVAGGKIRSGVPAQDVALGIVSGATWGPGGTIVFTDSAHEIIRRVHADGIVETIAGTGVTGFSGDGGPATSALLHAPGKPQYDAAGNLYFFDSENARIRRVDTLGVITTIAGDGIPYTAGMDLEGPALLRSISISDMAVDPAGIVYVSDSNSGLIRRVTKTGQLEIFAGANAAACSNCADGDGGPAKAAHLEHPARLALDSSGNLYVEESSETSQSSVIRRISPNGIITRFAGYGAFPGMNAPVLDGRPALDEYFGPLSGLAADGSGNLYVAYGGGYIPQLVRRIDSNGTINTVVNGQTGSLAADSSGKLLLFNAIRILQVSTEGTVTTIAPGNPTPAPDGILARDAWLLRPGPIAFNRAGELYFAEQQTCVIRKVDANGILTTFAGSGKCATALPIPPAPVSPDLFSPGSMAFDSQDRLWIAASFGRIFYVIAPDGSITAPPMPPTLGAGMIAFDAKDRLYLMDTYSLDRVSPDGSTQNIMRAGTRGFFPLPGPVGLGVDPAKNVYFASGDDGFVYRVNDDGSYTAVYEIPSFLGFVTHYFAIDAAGAVWGGPFHNEIFFTNASGSFSLGRPDQGYSGDGGPAQSARFYSPGSPALAPNGDLYVVDGDRIRRLTGIQPHTPPVISAGGIVNSASYNGGAISPGELVSIFGSNFGTSELDIAPYENNTVPSQLGRTKVLFDGDIGEIIAITPNLINVLVPYTVTPGGRVQVRVQVDATVSSPVTMPVVATIPDLYTTDESGSGPGIILNEDASVNSSMHPAPRGSLVALYGTGEGVLSPQLPTGALVISTPYPTMTNPPTVTIAGQPAEVRYAGAAPYFPLGVFEIDVRIPAATASGPAPISVTIGDGSTTRVVTVAVQ